MILYRKSVAYYLSGAHSQSCYYCCSSFRKCIIMQSNFVFFFSFHRGKKNIRKKERHFERSSCHFFFKESTFLERAPGGSHSLSRGAHRSKKKKNREKRKKTFCLQQFYFTGLVAHPATELQYVLLRAIIASKSIQFEVAI